MVVCIYACIYIYIYIDIYPPASTCPDPPPTQQPCYSPTWSNTYSSTVAQPQEYASRILPGLPCICHTHVHIQGYVFTKQAFISTTPV